MTSHSRSEGEVVKGNLKLASELWSLFALPGNLGDLLSLVCISSSWQGMGVASLLGRVGITVMEAWGNWKVSGRCPWPLL